jgi:glucokinase
VSIERVVSGAGIAALWAFVVKERLAPENAAVRAAMAQEDPAAVVTRHALDGSDPACAKALSMFLSLYGSEAGNFALKVLPTAGLYITGGIAPRIVGRLREGGEFMRAFLGKDRMGDTLARIPVRVVMHTRLGLLGARALAAQAVARHGA